MTESWSSRWYAPLVVLAVAALVLLIVALAIVEVLVASAPMPTPAGWTAPLERADEALRDGDVSQALAWWREARMEALRSGGWEGLIEVGDASRRLGARGGFRRDGEARARDAYMTALVRARRERSLDGMLRVATAFGEMGDRAVVAHALRIAEREAAEDPRAREHVRAVADRWMTPSIEAERPMTRGGQQP